MKSIKLRVEVKDKLMELDSSLSFNKSMELLLKDAEPSDEVINVDNNKMYYVGKIDDDLLVKLNKCRVYSNESCSDIVDRLIDEYHKKS